MVMDQEDLETKSQFSGEPGRLLPIATPLLTGFPLLCMPSAPPVPSLPRELPCVIIPDPARGSSSGIPVLSREWFRRLPQHPEPSSIGEFACGLSSILDQRNPLGLSSGLPRLAQLLAHDGTKVQVG